MERGGVGGTAPFSGGRVHPRPLRLVRRAAPAVLFVALIAVAVLSSIQVDYFVNLPAPAEAIDTHVTVQGHPLKPGRGSLYITFVYEQRATVLSRYWNQYFNADASVIPFQEVFGGGPAPSSQVQQQQSIAQMLGSKEDAELAALNVVGYAIPGEQVAVQQVAPQSNAYQKLLPNDVIVAVNGKAVHTPQQLIQAEGMLHPGDPITLLVKRSLPASGQRTFTLKVRTINFHGRPIIGIQPTTSYATYPHLPYKISIDSGDIGGPSAGLMFALSIINRFSAVDLTHGHKIAGTGTIDIDGNIGPIGGAKQKIIGARGAGAEYFFVPAYCNHDPRVNVCNYDEARPYAKGVKLVPVSTLRQALAFLRTLH